MLFKLLKRKKKTEKQEKHHILVITIILYLSAFLIPFVLIPLIQDALYYNKWHWFFGTPFEAYIVCMAGLLWIAVVFTIYLVIKIKVEHIALTIVTVILFCGSIPFFYVASTTYYYLDEEGIHYNQMMEFSETELAWKDVVQMNRIHQEENNTLYLRELQFINAEGESLVIPYDRKMFDFRWLVTKTIEDNGAKIKSIFKDEEGNIIKNY